MVAITNTLLILEIKPATDYAHLLHGLGALWPSHLADVVTLLFIGQVRANHHVLFGHICGADRIVLLPNTLLLMAVAFLPFATSVLAGALRAGHGERTSSSTGSHSTRPRSRSTPSGTTHAAGPSSARRSRPRARLLSAGASGSLSSG